VRLRAREIVLLTEANERQRGHWLPARETHHDWYLAPTLSVSKKETGWGEGSQFRLIELSCESRIVDRRGSNPGNEWIGPR
jgi:hypothetical protein